MKSRAEARPKRSESASLERLSDLVKKASPGPWRLDPDELRELPRLYRLACSSLARLEASGASEFRCNVRRRLVARAHGLLHQDLGKRMTHWPRALARYFLVDSPRTIRAEWRLLCLSLLLFYGLAGLSWWAVSRDLDLAFSLMDPGSIEAQIEQLQNTEGEAFRGNFTFGWGKSPEVAGLIMFHNIFVGVLFFASALFPPAYLLLLCTNGLMLGTYTAVAGHWGQAGSISSILWCHGTLELQAIVLAGTAGLVLIRGFLQPGSWSRLHALNLGARSAMRVFGPTVPILIVAGFIEGFVSPHATLPVRLAVAISSGALLLAWLLFCGRGAQDRADVT